MMKGLKVVGFMSALLVWALSGNIVQAAELPVEVEEVTAEDLDTTLMYGTRVVLQEGTTYYASADEFGSGPHGTIGNRYTPMGTDLYTGGFSLLNEDGKLEEYRGYNPKDVPVANDWQRNFDDVSWDQVWVEIFLDPNHESPIGWAPARSIVVLNGILGDGGSNERFRDGVKVMPKVDKPESDTPVIDDDLPPEVIDEALPDPGNMIEDRVILGQDEADDTGDTDDSEDAFISTREIAYAVEDYVEDGKKVALLLDASGSVSEYMSDIADYGEYVDKVNKAEIIITFADMFQTITVEDYLTVDVGSFTDIYAPINSLAGGDYDRVIIVTDTFHNLYTELAMQPDFAGKVVVVSPNSLDMIDQSVVAEIEDALGVTVYLCRLDNELDRLHAMEILAH